MRIAVAGKGGSGKTTMSATLARMFARQGYRVNALDGDPNPNLAAALGLSDDQISRLRRVPREEIFKAHVDQDGNNSLRLTRSFDDVLNDYAACGPDNVNVLMMTGLLGAGKG